MEVAVVVRRLDREKNLKSSIEVGSTLVEPVVSVKSRKRDGSLLCFVSTPKPTTLSSVRKRLEDLLLKYVSSKGLF